jgi:hypothetical protein
MSADVAAEGSGEPSVQDVETLVRALKTDFANHGAGQKQQCLAVSRMLIFSRGLQTDLLPRFVGK